MPVRGRVIVCAVLRAFASGSLFGERFGSSEPWVVALHGWARTHTDFSAVLGAVDGPGRPGGAIVAPEGEGEGEGEGELRPARLDAIDAIALDLPGFGATPPPPDPWGSAEYARVVGALLAETAPRVVLLGHSFGGRIAVHLAAAHPERVAAVVLSGVPLYRPDGGARRPPAAYRVVRGLARAGIVGGERLERARRRYGSADYRAASGVMRDVLVRVLGERYDDALGALACPVELVWGEQDREVPVAVARRAAGALGAATLVVLPGVGHLTPTEAPDALRDAVLRHRP